MYLSFIDNYVYCYDRKTDILYIIDVTRKWADFIITEVSRVNDRTQRNITVRVNTDVRVRFADLRSVLKGMYF